VRKKGLKDTFNLPDPPLFKVNPYKRLAVAAVVAVAVIAGIAFFPFGSSATPDEKATALSAQVAPDVLRVISGNDVDGDANAAIQRAKTEFTESSGCSIIAGVVTMGNTAKKAAAVANKRILQARDSSLGTTLGENLGLGYAVIPTRGLIPGVNFVAMVTAIDCTPAPAGPTGLGS
jgi:hypothetical protein